MKKILFIFLALDIIFVSLVLKLSTDKERAIANISEPTEGQLQKLEILNSLKLDVTENEIILKTNMLQSLCASTDSIELKFKALNIAYSGKEPLIKNIFNCTSVLKNSGQNSLNTLLVNFKLLNKKSVISDAYSELTSSGLFSDEELPLNWKLFEITFSGKSAFSINENEINQVLGDEAFKFKLLTF